MYVKVVPILLPFLFIIGLLSCDSGQEDPIIKISGVYVDQCEFTGCLETKSSIPFSTLEITSSDYGYLLFRLFDTEFCCGTDSILIGVQKEGTFIDLVVYDMGPYSWCFCPHDLEFTLGPFLPGTYDFRLVESVDACKRDTFRFSLDLTGIISREILPLDTTTCILSDSLVTPPADTSLHPPVFLETLPGGCNTDTPGTGGRGGMENRHDTVYTWITSDTLHLFAGLNYICCAPFITAYQVAPDGTLEFFITDTCIPPFSECYCRCDCYYTFEFLLLPVEPGNFPYRVYVNNPKQGGTYLFDRGSITIP